MDRMLNYETTERFHNSIKSWFSFICDLLNFISEDGLTYRSRKLYLSKVIIMFKDGALIRIVIYFRLEN